MSRSFRFSVESPATVEQIQLAFSREEYWLARLANFGGSGRLDSLTVGSDGGIVAILVHDLRPEGLSGPLAKFYPSQWRLVQTEAWHPIGDGRVRGEVRVVAHGAPGSGAGRALLAPTRRGSQFKCTANVVFRVPLIGGQIENMMGRSLVENTAAVQEFTAQWIGQHA